MIEQTIKAPVDVPGQTRANVKRQDKHSMKSKIFQVAVGFLFGICTSIFIGVAKQRSGTVGGEILLFPIVMGLIVVSIKHYERSECRKNKKR